MTAKASLQPHLRKLVDALSLTVSGRSTMVDSNTQSSSSMNVETSTNHLPSHQHHHPADEHEFSTDRFPIKLEPKAQQSSSSPPPLLGKFLSPLLAQAKGGGLSQIPQSTLYDNLQLVISALENLDAEALLDLETFPSAEQSPPGPRVRDGVYCRPIRDQIRPVVDNRPGHSCVRYLHVSEVPDQYSIGIFVFGPNAKIPLHDHPDMVVLSRVLYGDLHRLSLDLARDEEASLLEDEYDHVQSGGQRTSSWFRGSWFHRMNSIRNKLPKGSKAAFKNEVDFLQAPDVTVLYPYEGNLHEFVAGPNGAAVLDVLLPPYDNVQNRDCTFYTIQNIDGSSHDGVGVSLKKKKEPCFIIPTGQPENFHCISGQYRDLGEPPDCNRDAEMDMEDSFTVESNGS